MKYPKELENLLSKYATIIAFTVISSGTLISNPNPAPFPSSASVNLEKTLVFNQIMDLLYPYSMYLGKVVLRRSNLETELESVIISASYESIRHHAEGVKFETRLFQTIKSRCINYLSRDHKKLEKLVPLETVDEVAGGNREDHINNSIMKVDLEVALGALPVNKSSVLQLLSEGYNYQEIAEAYEEAYGTQMSQWTIRNWHQQGIKELKRSGLLAGYGPL